MPAGYFGAWFLQKLLKGRTAQQVERGFWIFVASVIAFLALGVLFMTFVPGVDPIVFVVGFVVAVIALLAVRAWGSASS